MVVFCKVGFLISNFKVFYIMYSPPLSPRSISYSLLKPKQNHKGKRKLWSLFRGVQLVTPEHAACPRVWPVPVLYGRTLFCSLPAATVVNSFLVRGGIYVRIRL